MNQTKNGNQNNIIDRNNSKRKYMVVAGGFRYDSDFVACRTLKNELLYHKTKNINDHMESRIRSKHNKKQWKAKDSYWYFKNFLLRS